MANFAALYGEVGQSFSPNDVTRVKLWTNFAYHNIVGRRLWKWSERRATIAGVIGQSAYALVGNTNIPGFRDMIDVVTAQTGAKLVYTDPELYDLLAQATVTFTGAPAFYTIAGGAPEATSAAVAQGGVQQLQVWPPPNTTSNLLIRYYRYAVDMVADTDVPMTPPHWDSAIVALAMYHGLLSDDQVWEAGPWQQLAEQKIAAMVAEDAALVSDVDQLVMRAGVTLERKSRETPQTFNPAVQPLPTPS